MLVLSRKVGERIVVARNVEITVIEIRGDRVKIGFNAPREIPIVREEACGGDTQGAANGGADGAEQSPFFAECA